MYFRWQRNVKYHPKREQRKKSATKLKAQRSWCDQKRHGLQVAQNKSLVWKVSMIFSFPFDSSGFFYVAVISAVVASGIQTAVGETVEILCLSLPHACAPLSVHAFLFFFWRTEFPSYIYHDYRVLHAYFLPSVYERKKAKLVKTKNGWQNAHQRTEKNNSSTAATTILWLSFYENVNFSSFFVVAVAVIVHMPRANYLAKINRANTKIVLAHTHTYI